MLQIKIFETDELKKVKRTETAEKVKIPYRVALRLIKSLDGTSIEEEENLIRFVTGNIEKVDKVIKATFDITENEMECIDMMDLIEVGKELFAWVMDEVKKLKKVDPEKNE